VKPLAQDIYTKIKQCHNECYGLVKELLASAPKNQEELADIAYALNECTALLKDLGKITNGGSETCQKIACALWSQAEQTQPIRTDHMTATPRIRYMATLPSRKKDPEGFAALMTHLGIPQYLWDVPEGQPVAAQLNWPGMVELLTQQAEQGLPLPKGVDPSKTYPVYALTIRGRKEVNLVSE